jgi:hypothetical protein
MREYFRRTSPFVVLATFATSMYLYITDWPEIATVSGFTLHITDILFFIATVYCMAGAFTRWYRSVSQLAVLIVAGLLVLSFARGVAASGWAAAGVDFRFFSGFISAAAFAYFWGRELNIEWVFDRIIWLGWAIVVLGAARLVLGLDAFIHRPSVEEALKNPAVLELLNDPESALRWANPRIMNGAAALMLGQASLVALDRAASSSLPERRLLNSITFIVFATTLLISAQRTASFATLCGLFVIVAGFRARPLLSMTATISLSIALVFGAMWLASGGNIAPYLPRSIAMVILDQGTISLEVGEADRTFAWRVDQWQNFLNLYSRAPLIDQIVGQPLGILRLEFGPSSVLNAHNQYVQLLANAGVAGSLLFTSVILYGLFKGLLLLLCLRGAHSSNIAMSTAIIASQAVDSIGYTLGTEQGFLLVIALQLLAAASREAHRVAPFALARAMRRPREVPP